MHWVKLPELSVKKAQVISAVLLYFFNPLAISVNTSLITQSNYIEYTVKPRIMNLHPGFVRIYQGDNLIRDCWKNMRLVAVGIITVAYCTQTGKLVADYTWNHVGLFESPTDVPMTRQVTYIIPTYQELMGAQK